MSMHNGFQLRSARQEDYEALGDLTVRVYQQLPDMPGPDQMPEYYKMLRDTATRAQQPTVEIFVAASEDGDIVGGATFIGDAAHYGANTETATVSDASGIRLLVVDPMYQGYGLGKALSVYCVDRANYFGRKELLLHTTKSMQVAWRLYENLGFQRAPELDFLQAYQLEVFGFRMSLDGIGKLTPSIR